MHTSRDGDLLNFRDRRSDLGFEENCEGGFVSWDVLGWEQERGLVMSIL